MSGRRRSGLAVEAERRNREQLATVGRELKVGRTRRHLTQAELGARVGLSRGSISRAERGLGGGLTLDGWQRIGIALTRPLVIRLQSDTDGETADAGHLAMQELILRIGRAAGYEGRFEVATRPAEPWRSTDVGLVDPRRRQMVLVECWNSIGDIGAAARSSDRKRAEAGALAAASWGEDAATTSSVWVIRATSRNRAIVARYPEVFLARFPGSSYAWVESLVHGATPPEAAGIVWCDVASTRLFPWRRPAVSRADQTAVSRADQTAVSRADQTAVSRADRTVPSPRSRARSPRSRMPD